MHKNNNRYGLTPPGVALWPCVNVPDTKYSSDGLYFVKLKLDLETATPFVEAIDARAETCFNAARARALSPELAAKVREASPPYAPCDEGAAYVFSFKVKASGVTRGKKPYKNVCRIYDEKGNIRRYKVGHGSIIRVSYRYEPYYTALVGAGIKLVLDAIQVIKLCDPTKPDASHFGFVNENMPEVFRGAASV
jgi:hypothetical protein